MSIGTILQLSATKDNITIFPKSSDPSKYNSASSCAYGTWYANDDSFVIGIVIFTKLRYLFEYSSVSKPNEASLSFAIVSSALGIMRFESNAKGKSEIELRAQSVEEIEKNLCPRELR